MTESDKYAFRYRLLASADIVGSTAYKSAQAGRKAAWAHVFASFFDEFPSVVADRFGDLPSGLFAAKQKPSSAMQVWKYVGDEVLFEVEVATHEHVAFHVLAFKLALDEYGESLREKHPSLGLKGCIWGAGFPVNNVEFMLKGPAGSAEVRDFLGPSVDLGFRLARFADARRIPISADVAYLLDRCIADSQHVSRKLRFGIEQFADLKGIDSRNYPVLWVDRLGSESPEDVLLGRSSRRESGAVRAYLQTRYDSPTVALSRPFIVNDSDASLRVVPHEVDELRARLEAGDSDFLYQRDYEADDPRAPGRSDDPPLPSSVD